ncbi:MAG TPA: lantibiotic dehydratase [Pyrinomonadaceae bacterium]
MTTEAPARLQPSHSPNNGTAHLLSQAPHLTAMPDGRWGVWRSIALRGAGFPAAQVFKLAVPEHAAAIDNHFAQIEEAEQQARLAQTTAVDLAHHCVDRLTVDEQRAAMERVLKKLQKGKVPATEIADDAVRMAVERLRSAREQIESAKAKFDESFAAALQQNTIAISEIASQERFREAVIWQNRHVYQTAIQPFLERESTSTRSSKQRQREELIANYWQRYCVKNDTIGFFGPVGWARVVPGDEVINVRPGSDLVATRNVRFEGWGIDALIRSLMRESTFAHWLIPRRLSLIDIDNTLLHLPLQAPINISVEQATLLLACDGSKNAKQVARDLLEMPNLGFKTEADVFRKLAELRNRRLISWEWSSPIPHQVHPEKVLAEMFAGIEEETLRQTSLSKLNELDENRQSVARAAGNPEQLAQALENLETTFSRLTGAAPTRSHGRMYAARTLVYEDCRRDIEVDIGEKLIHSLGAPLTLLLEGARWFSFELAGHVRQVVDKIYADLARKAGSPVVEAAAFYDKVRPLIFTPESPIYHSVLALFHKRWAEILKLDPQAHRLQYSSEELKPRVLSAFPAPRAGWPNARFHSPDVMIEATDQEAIRRGDYQLVLGELHPGEITISNGIFVGQHPSPEELFQALEIDLPESRVLPIASRTQPGGNARTSLLLLTSRDYFLDYSLDSAHIAPQRTLSLGNIVFEKNGAGLIARTRDRRLAFDVMHFMGSALTSIGGADLKVVPPARHTPRITIDRFVVAREAWRFPPSEITFVDEQDEAYRFINARRWAQQHGLPRFVFVKTPAEVKPFFVDFDSPVLINIFAKMVHRTLTGKHSDPLVSLPPNPKITISEMLPTPDKCWLPDAAGQHYTSELRMVVVDLIDKLSRSTIERSPA